jgi:hypothetical protein
MPMSSRRDEPPQISLNGSPSVRDSLRQATHAAHVRLNHHPLLQNLTRPSQTLEGYCRVLAAYARFYRPLEDWIVASLAALDLDFCYESRRKLPWLLADLDYFEIQPGSPSGPTALAPLITDRGLDSRVSRNGDIWLVELDSLPASEHDLFHNLFIPIRDALWQLDALTDMQVYVDRVVEQMRLLSGFDRVMMYQFDTNWDGEVIAESKGDGFESYLGNRFPASDIPPQARELYTPQPDPPDFRRRGGTGAADRRRTCRRATVSI